MGKVTKKFDYQDSFTVSAVESLTVLTFIHEDGSRVIKRLKVGESLTYQNNKENPVSDFTVTVMDDKNGLQVV
ncbi:MAG: hypothetical protein AB8B89_10475 [Gammaproteobacteria bacterium]